MEPAQNAQLPVLFASLAFLLAFGFGAVANRVDFCTMGAVPNVVNFGGWRRIRMWVLAIAVTVAGSAGLTAAGLLQSVALLVVPASAAFLTLKVLFAVWRIACARPVAFRLREHGHRHLRPGRSGLGRRGQVLGAVCGSHGARALCAKGSRVPDVPRACRQAGDRRRLVLGFGGGVTALGRTIGQGLTGMSMLAVGSILTFGSTVGGGVAAVRTKSGAWNNGVDIRATSNVK